MDATSASELKTHYISLDRIAAQIDEEHGMPCVTARVEEVIEQAVAKQIESAIIEIGRVIILDVKMTEKHILFLYVDEWMMFDEKNHRTGTELFEQELKKPVYLVDDFLVRQSLTNLTGPPGGGKTILALHIVVNNILKNFLDKDCIPFRTLFIDEENGLSQTQYIFQLLCNNTLEYCTETEKDTMLDNVDFYCMDGFRLSDKYRVEITRLLRRLRAAKRLPDLIIIDNVSRIFEGDSNTQGDAKLIHRMFKGISIEFNLAVLLISHTRKGNPNTLQDISGSGDFGAQVTISYISKRIGKETNPKYSFKKVKNNLGMPTSPSITYRIRSFANQLEVKYEGVTSELYRESKVDDLVKALTQIMEPGENSTRKAITLALEDAKFKKGTINKHLFEEPIDGFKKISRGVYCYDPPPKKE